MRRVDMFCAQLRLPFPSQPWPEDAAFTLRPPERCDCSLPTQLLLPTATVSCSVGAMARYFPADISGTAAQYLRSVILDPRH